MKPDGRGVTVVGDDAQSIYSFRARRRCATSSTFRGQFTPPARVVTLERNYRSTQPILDASNAVIAAGRASATPRRCGPTGRRPSGRSWCRCADEAQQARWVADRVLAHREAGIALKSQAVLFRTSHHSAALELELARRNIPFVKFGGLKFLEAAHVKDVLAVLRWARTRAAGMAGFRVAQLVPGIGPATSTRLLDAMDDGGRSGAALRAFEPPAARAATTGRASSTLLRQLRAPAPPGRPTWSSRIALVPAAARAAARRRRACAAADLDAARAHRRGLRRRASAS